MLIRSPEELDRARLHFQKKLEQQVTRVLVCAGTGCVAGGSLQVYKRIREVAMATGLTVEIILSAEADGDDCPGQKAEKSATVAGNADPAAKARKAKAKPIVGLKHSGCHGFCELGPLVRIEPQGWLYIGVTEDDAPEIVEQTLQHGLPVERLMYHAEGRCFARQDDIPFYRRQTRVVL